MMKNRYINTAVILLSMLAMISCDKFLDVVPDNRADVDTVEKIQALLGSAYLTVDYATVTEFSSDNVCCAAEDNPNTDRFLDQVYAWEDITETNNSDLESLWQSCYSAISASNAALKAIEKLGGAVNHKLSAAKGEALICRAYAHFILVNVFGLHYNSKTSASDLGVVYMTESEHTLRPEYKRNSVAEVYARIDQDLQDGLPLISDEFYKVPKYHFTEKAAYAFASRFYLYYEDWQKCIEYADLVLGKNPKSMLRDYKALSEMTQDYSAITNEYVKADHTCNLMMGTSYAGLGLAFGPYRYWTKYTQTAAIIDMESAGAVQPWGRGTYFSPVHRVDATHLNRAFFMRLPYMFEYTDAVAGIGYYRCPIPLFTTDETLLNRAEAYILMKEYDKAAADMNLWIENMYRPGTTEPIDEKVCKAFYDRISYSNDEDSKTPLVQTVKKHLNPAFLIDEKGSEQESMLQAVLMMKRIDSDQLGLRWFDIKRYGIEIARLTMGVTGMPSEITDRLRKDDPRRALQIPLKVQSAGIEPNPRNK